MCVRGEGILIVHTFNLKFTMCTFIKKIYYLIHGNLLTSNSVKLRFWGFFLDVFSCFGKVLNISNVSFLDFSTFFFRFLLFIFFIFTYKFFKNLKLINIKGLKSLLKLMHDSLLRSMHLKKKLSQGIHNLFFFLFYFFLYLLLL